MFKKKEKTEKAPKNKKVRTMKVETHKKSVLLLWVVLLASTSFGVYKRQPFYCLILPAQMMCCCQ